MTSSEDDPVVYPYIFVHRERGRHGLFCRKIGRPQPAQMWVQIEFQNGTTAVVPTTAIRRREGM